jgi:hypothetical protein
MNVRTTAACLALAAGSLLFVAHPALQAQDYYNDGRYYGDRYYDSDYRQQRAIEHDRQEIDRHLYRGEYRAARKEARELEKRQRKLARDQYRRQREYREHDSYWDR